MLPFVNFSGAKEDEFFSDGITEDLVTQLAQISDLKVISRTSILEYRDSKKPLREIARELGVDHILQGSVRRGETRFRINAQLIDPAKEGHLWAKSYDREIKDVLVVQSEVTAEIAAALRARLLKPEKEQLEKRAKANPEAYVLYKRAEYLMAWHPSRTLKDQHRAREYLEKVVELDPTSPLGYAGLAKYHMRLYTWQKVTPEIYERAEAFAKKALAADERSVEANLTLAALHARAHWDWRKAESFAKRAIELGPGAAEVWFGYAYNVLTPTGRLEEAGAALRRALTLDPLNVEVAQALAYNHSFMGRCDEATRQARINLDLDRTLRFQHIIFALCHERSGNLREAIAAWRLAKGPWLPDNVLDELQAIVDSPAGNAAPAAYWRARLAWNKKYGGGLDYYTAAYAAEAGEMDEAFRYLNRAIDRRERQVFVIKVDPQLDRMRQDPRFASALARMNLN